MRGGKTASALLTALFFFCGIAWGQEVIRDFTFTGIDGKTLRSAELSGRPLVIVMLASWCPPCKKEAPDLEKAHLAYKEKGVLFLGIFVASSDKSILRFAEKYRLTFPVGKGDGISGQFGRKPFPATMFVSRDGTILGKHFGEVGYDELVAGIEEILK
jgi:thiol-disulfide isomerase/thioredoxin